MSKQMAMSDLEIALIDKMRQMRIEKNLTQKELNTSSGLRVGAIGQIESYAAHLSLQKLEKIAPVFGMTATSLLNEVWNEMPS